MELNEMMRISIENVRTLTSNSIQLLRDTDLLLAKSGYNPLHGNTIGSETSKNINQSASSRRNFLPAIHVQILCEQTRRCSTHRFMCEHSVVPFQSRGYGPLSHFWHMQIKGPKSVCAALLAQILCVRSSTRLCRGRNDIS